MISLVSQLPGINQNSAQRWITDFVVIQNKALSMECATLTPLRGIIKFLFSAEKILKDFSLTHSEKVARHDETLSSKSLLIFVESFKFSHALLRDNFLVFLLRLPSISNSFSTRCVTDSLMINPDCCIIRATMPTIIMAHIARFNYFNCRLPSAAS